MKYLVVIAICMATGCATLNSRSDTAVSYLDNVKQNFEAGEKAFADKTYDEAEAYFEHVRSKYPYSQYAVLSDLKLADIYFAQEKWLEAADAYDFYIRFHPRHEHVDYAWFQIAKSYFKAIPDDLFVFPRSYLRDQTSTKEALSAVDRYLAEFPTHSGVEEAKKMRVELRSQLALRDMKVAQFYVQRKKWRGAKTRFDRVMELYPDTEIVKQAAIQSKLSQAQIEQ